MAKLKEEFKRKWIAALRSGEYTQCTEHLELGGGYCCLGVALKVMYPNAEPEYHQAFLREDEVPSLDDAREWWEFLPPSHVNNPLVAIPRHVADGELARATPRYVHLSELNDEEGYTFAQIADIIEAQL